MQQRNPQQGYRFPQNQQPLHRFPQNQPAMQGYEQQPGLAPKPWQGQAADMCEDCPYRKQASKHRRHRRFSLLRSVFTGIGVVTVGYLVIKYVIIPLLVYVNVLAGGTL